MKFASFEANLDGSRGHLVYPILLFSLPLSGMSPDMTEILLTEALNLNLINQFNVHHCFYARNKLHF